MPTKTITHQPSKRFRVCLAILKIGLIMAIATTILFLYIYAFLTKKEALTTAYLEQSISPLTVDRDVLEKAHVRNVYKTESHSATYTNPFVD